ncbi:unnamed protein product [Polarella glacialis]|uniref:Reverse transcriptase domain-containing protein n=1 Tax=Polarella glacialis TaxID=89957 RepID=A0A813EIQ8_POLGL|nr:unnamed protein product [Polarella glacialis]
MLSALSEELRKVGLELNASKSKSLSTHPPPELRHFSSVTCIDGKYIHILSSSQSHMYLGRQLIFSKHRADFAIKGRISAGWAQFRKRRSILMNEHVPAKLRIKLFCATIIPCLMFGLSTVTAIQKHLKSLDAVRMKMLRNMAGWRRLDGDTWRDTMCRMTGRVNALLTQGTIPFFSQTLLLNKWRWAGKTLAGNPSVDSWPSRAYASLAPMKRNRGRPLIEWQDDVLLFLSRSGVSNIPAAANNKSKWSQLEALFVSSITARAALQVPVPT